MAPEPEGLLVLDKPEGISSARALARVKGIVRAGKAGHTGTLDPFATGVLICCLGRATRLSRYFLESDKRYEGTLFLGVETDTLDRTGTVVAEHPAPTPTAEAVEAAFAAFRGPILQEPPAFSALKHEGTPLYRLARKGEPVRKPARSVTIHRLEVAAIRPPEIDFRATCSAGTYVRTLAADIGRTLGSGAHLSALRRTGSGALGLDRAVTPDRLEGLVREGRLREVLIDMADALSMPSFRVGPELAGRIRHGNPLTAADLPGAAPDDDGRLQVLDPDGRLLAVLRRTDGDGYDYGCVLG